MKRINSSSILQITRLTFFKKLLYGIMAIVFPWACKKGNNEENPDNTPSKQQTSAGTKVFLVKNGTVRENINKVLELAGGITKYVQSSDIVVLKGNAQWPRQGYTNTECIKYVIDAILAIPNFSGEILICDNIQNTPADGDSGFFASPGNRVNNWPDHNWSTLAAEYKSKGRPVAMVQWNSSPLDHNISGPADGWIRDFFEFHRLNTYLSYPVFESPLTVGRLIDMKNGVWERGGYTGRKVKAIFMPTLNNHGFGSEDYAGITSALKCFFGATEIHVHEDSTVNFSGQRFHHLHSATYTNNNAYYAGELAARFMKNMYKPVLFLTCAIWSGHESRTGAAINTKTVLACENPATLDYVACKRVISPYASWLDPDKNTNTRKQILGCVENGIGTIDQFDVVEYDFA